MRTFILSFVVFASMGAVAFAGNCQQSVRQFKIQKNVQAYALPVVVPQYFVAPPQVQLEYLQVQQQNFHHHHQNQQQNVKVIERQRVGFLGAFLDRLANRNVQRSLLIQRNVSR